MGGILREALYWAPRTLGILFALFLSLFALDVLRQGYGVFGTILGLLIHLLPVYVVVLALLLAWRWEWLGGLLFIGLAVLYLVWAWGRFPWVTYLAVSGPLLVVGALFLVSWRVRARAQAA